MLIRLFRLFIFNRQLAPGNLLVLSANNYCPFVSHLPPLVAAEEVRAGRRTVTNRLVFVLFNGTLVILWTLPKHFFLKQVDRYAPQSDQPSPPVLLEAERAEGGGGDLYRVYLPSFRSAVLRQPCHGDYP